MEKTGMKHKLILTKASQLTIIFWLLFSTISSLIINNGVDLKHLITSTIFYSLFFLPIYFLMISLILNNEYKRRTSISFIALIPVLLSYFILFNKMDFIILDPVKLIFLIILLFSINMILSIENKLYILIISTFINTFIPIVIYFIYLNQYSSLKEYTLIGIYNQDKYLFDTYLILVITIQILLIFIYYFVKLIKQRKEDNHARNSGS